MTAVAVALITLLVTCLAAPAYESNFSMTVTPPLSANSFFSVSSTQSSSYFYETAPYPFDDSVAQYVESLKPQKATGGRINPFSSLELLSESKLYSYLTESRYRDFLRDRGIDGQIHITSGSGKVTVAFDYDDKELSQTLKDNIVSLTGEYLSTVSTEYIHEILETHTALLKSDKTALDTIITQYNAAALKAGSGPLASETCRALLNEYAQTAYNYDISSSVVSLSNQILSLNLTPEISLLEFSSQSNHSPMKIAAFGVFGFIIGLILGGFLVFFFSLCSRVFRAAHQNANFPEAAPSSDDIKKES